MTTLETLKAARAKIADPEHWTQGAFGRDAIGNPISDEDKPLTGKELSVAVRLCASGSLITCGGEIGDAAYRLLREHAEREVCDFNDSHTHAEVLALFDKAIAEAK